MNNNPISIAKMIDKMNRLDIWHPPTFNLTLLKPLTSYSLADFRELCLTKTCQPLAYFEANQAIDQSTVDL